jgi:hypothetical protein
MGAGAAGGQGELTLAIGPFGQQVQQALAGAGKSGAGGASGVKGHRLGDLEGDLAPILLQGWPGSGLLAAAARAPFANPAMGAQNERKSRIHGVWPP